VRDKTGHCDLTDAAVMNTETRATQRGERSHAVRATWGFSSDEFGAFIKERARERRLREDANARGVVLMSEDGAYVWFGTLAEFTRENGEDVARDVLAQWLESLRVHSRHEPAVIGGGASPLFFVLLSE
jgi:hypothetical protein